MLSPIDEIKNRLDIVEVIGSYLKLQKTGVNYRALCPFHSEKKPSFFVSPARQIWHCFGCGKGGSIFNFVMEIEGVEFGDALRLLAKKAGVELKKQTPESASWRTQRQRLYEICELATKFFEKQLESSKGKEVKGYLLKRGINEESIKKWRLGWSPDTWQGLSDFLVSKRYKKEEIEKVGLLIKNEMGGYYDRFRGRIIFPIFDLSSQVIGFTGRVFGQKEKEEIAKYVNTPNTLLYDKSRVLYGLDKAKLSIRKKNQCVLVEGQTDVIMSQQAGNENVVATSGTALTPFQLNTLKRYSENLVTAFDMDIAGDSATKKGIDLAQARGFNIKVTSLPKDSDPADVILKNPEDWKESLSQARSILEFYFESTLAKFDSKTPEGKKEISTILLPVIKRIPNRIVQAHWVTELAKKLEVKEEDVEVELKKCILPNLGEIWEVGENPVQVQPSIKSRKEMLEERIVSLILKSPQIISLINESCFGYFSPKTTEVLANFKKNPIPDFFNNLESYKFSPEINNFLNYLSLKAEVDFDALRGKADLETELIYCLEGLRLLEIKNKLDEIAKRIKQSEEEKDSKKVAILAQEFNSLTEELTNNIYEKKENKVEKI